MPLSRLENFLKNAEGNILYVNPSDFDSTDSFENQGNSLTRPFKTIQRALIEAARFSYQTGRNNDKIDRTTILVYPGTHYIDNRPGFSIENIGGSAVFKKRTGTSTWSVDTSLTEFSSSTNLDILDTNNDLYKFNSVEGGVILPRGTSIIGLDLRKTKIRPLYVPNPEDTLVERSSILKVTGTCYFTAFTIFDADPSKTVFKDYSNNRYVPNFSHHKLTTFTYADGVNKVILGSTQTSLTDLDMYYFKVAKAYGDTTGRGLSDYPVGIDFEPNIDEFRIVGNLQSNTLGISSIFAGNGDGTGNLNTITVTTTNSQTGQETPHNLYQDSPILISGIEVEPTSFNGSFTVSEIVGLTTFRYITPTAPSNYIPDPSLYDTAIVQIESDTVNSASPYIFNCSLRSVYGLCGLWADGAKATGFKSMVVAQFTGVSLQKDDNAFIIYENGTFYDNFTLPVDSEIRPLHVNSRSIYKPEYENYHIRCSNDGFIQNVSVFAIGFSKHFLTESGGDMSITNSNSNFGAISLESKGYKEESFDRDDVGYITHIIPPKEITSEETEVSWLSLDAQLIVTALQPQRLYLFNQNSQDVIPPYQVNSYRVGAKLNDTLNLNVTVGSAETTYSSPILMPVPSGTAVSSQKEYIVSRTGSVNDISLNTINFTTNHQLYNGEKVRVFSDTGQVPDGLEVNAIYYAITTGLAANQIRLALSLNDAIANNEIVGINNNGGIIKIVSSVSDKIPGELGHPIQYDTTRNSWYVTSATTNPIYSAVVGLGTITIGTETGSAYIKRKLDNRSIEDRIYKLRYVVPKEFENARPPQAGFIIQESKTVGVSSISFTNDALTSEKDLRNEKLISFISAGSIASQSQTITVTTETPHEFIVGDVVKVNNVRSTNNLFASGITSSYNGSYNITNVLDSRKFQYVISGVSTNPGTFTSAVNSRATTQQRSALPTVSRKSYKNTFFIYRVNTIKKHIPGAEGQDGIYHIIALNSNVAPSSSIGFNLSEKKFNQDVRNLYPQVDRDNYVSDPTNSVSYSDLSVVGRVITDDKRNSVTRESLNEFLKNTRVGLAITGVTITGTGNTTAILYTNIQHNLNSIKSFTFSSGSGYSISTTNYSTSLLTNTGLGTGANAKIVTNSSGQVISVSLVDTGTSYAVNNTLNIAGSATPGIVTVTSINNNINDALQLSGFNKQSFNGTYRIVDIPNSTTIRVHNPLGFSSYVANTNGSLPFLVLSADSIGITSFRFTSVATGIVTVTTSTPHGLLAGNKFTIVGSGHTIYDNSFTVEKNIGITTFSFNIGFVTTSSKSSTTGFVLKQGIGANATNIGRGEENLGSRGCYLYAGISTAISATFDTSSTTITLSNADGFKRGDHLLVNSEIIRLASTTNPFTVIRGEFGTYKTSAVSGSIVKKVRVLPVEIRRPSFMRASGHTFEYLGYGPGNYSTGIPQKQNRILSEDEVLVSQAREQDGGTVVYTGMNDLGEFYTGSKKLSSATGEEKVVEAPIITFTGDDAQGELSNFLSAIYDEVLIRQRLTVEGGENNNQSSQFYGPVNFTQKVTNFSDLGIDTKNLFIKGYVSQSKLLTVTNSSPTTGEISSPTAGDISFLSNPSSYLGNVYTSGEWRPFGVISREPNTLDIGVNRLTVNYSGPTSAYDLDVGGDARLENLLVTGGVTFTQPLSLGNVTFESVFINKTAYFPLGIATAYTQIHSGGISQLYNLETIGVSTFIGNIYNSSGTFYGSIGRFGNARITDGLLNQDSGTLTINSNSGTTIIDDSLDVNGKLFKVTTKDPVIVGVATTASIFESRGLTLGYGHTSNSSYIDLHNDYLTFPNYGLRIIRNSGIGSVSSQIRHRGNQPLEIIAEDNTNVSIFSNSIERLRVGSGGTITYYQNNSGGNLRGAHFKLNQNGIGDVALSWDITYNNANRRWYAGIDTSDGYSWKLANPSILVQYGNENFDVDTKLKVATTGDATLSGAFELSGTSISYTGAGTFNLIDTNATTINAFGAAVGITMGSTASNAFVFIRSTKEATSIDDGALVVDGGVGIEKNTFIGGKIDVNQTARIGQHLNVTGVSTLPTAYINGGSIDNTPIGATTRSTGRFTSIDANAESTFNGSVVNSLVLKKYGETVSALGSVSGTATIDLNNGNVFTATLNGTTTFSIANTLASANTSSSFTLILTNGAGGPYTVAWPASVKFPNSLSPARTTDGGKTDIWIFITPDQGTTWYANIALYNFG